MARSAWRGIQYAVYVTGVLHCDWLVSCVVCDGCVPHCDARVLHLSALLSTLFGSVSISLFVVKEQVGEVVPMFQASLLPSLSVYGSWTTMTDVCAWAAVSDEMWVQFAEQLGDASLQNISLVAAMQPDDIKEAIEAAITGVVARTKLRLVYAAARLKFGLDPFDVGAPLPAAPAEPVCVGPRGGGGAPTLKIKVASVLDQASDREVERMPMEVLNKLRARFRAVEGEDPMKAEEVTDDQLSVIFTVVQAGIAPYADFGVWRPFGQRAAKNMKFGGAKKFLDPTHCLRGRRAGVSFARQPLCAISKHPQCWTDTVQHSAREWSVSRTVGRCVLSRTPGAGVNIGRQCIGGSHSSTTRVRSCQLPSLSARGTASFGSPPTTEISGKRSWKIKSWTSGRFGQWYRRRQGAVGARKKSGAGRGLQRVQRGSNEAVLEGITHCEEAMDGIAPIPLANKSASNSIGTLVDAQESVQRSEHTCVSSAWSLTVPSNVRGIQGGGPPPKGAGKGKHKGKR